jgi:hypothetical protein
LPFRQEIGAVLGAPSARQQEMIHSINDFFGGGFGRTIASAWTGVPYLYVGISLEALAD